MSSQKDQGYQTCVYKHVWYITESLNTLSTCWMGKNVDDNYYVPIIDADSEPKVNNLFIWTLILKC